MELRQRLASTINKARLWTTIIKIFTEYRQIAWRTLNPLHLLLTLDRLLCDSCCQTSSRNYVPSQVFPIFSNLSLFLTIFKPSPLISPVNTLSHFRHCPGSFTQQNVFLSRLTSDPWPLCGIRGLIPLKITLLLSPLFFTTFGTFRLSPCFPCHLWLLEFCHKIADQLFWLKNQLKNWLRIIDRNICIF